MCAFECQYSTKLATENVLQSTDISVIFCKKILKRLMYVMTDNSNQIIYLESSNIPKPIFIKIHEMLPLISQCNVFLTLSLGKKQTFAKL